MKTINPFEEVKRRVDIVAVIEKFTGMAVTGRGNHRQLPECPFCKGHHCFSITIDKQLFNCFQCPGESTGGDVFSFLARLKGYDLRSALETLAVEVGVLLPHASVRSKPGIREEIMRQTKADWSLPEAKSFWDYLVDERKLSGQVLKAHDVGYLRSRSDLISNLKKKGYAYDEIKDSGILTRDFGGRYRILFGWRGLDGKIEGFVCAMTRNALASIPLAEKDRYPKYKKSAHFQAQSPYNLFYAKRRVPDDRTLVIVEGIVDCLQLRSHGIHNVVALGGSALKEVFIPALERTRFERLILLFDSDHAGTEGTDRAIRILLKEGPKFSLYVAQIGACDPEDETRIIKDPDEVICKKGPEVLRAVIDVPVKAGPWIVGAMWNQNDMKNPLHRDKVLQDVGTLWHCFPDEVEKKEMLVVLSEACALPQAYILKTIEQYGARLRKTITDVNKANIAEQSTGNKGVASSAQTEKHTALKIKLKSEVRKNRELVQTNRLLLKAYTRLICQAKALSKAGLLWHVSRLAEGHTMLIKRIRNDPNKATALIKKVDAVFSASKLNDLAQINRDIEDLSETSEPGGSTDHA